MQLTGPPVELLARSGARSRTSGPAPELRLFPLDREAARRALERLLAWDFDRAVIAHCELLDHEPKDAIREAWRWLLDQ